MANDTDKHNHSTASGGQGRSEGGGTPRPDGRAGSAGFGRGGPHGGDAAAAGDAEAAAAGYAPDAAAGGLAETIIRAAARGPAPVHLWDPPYCGEMDLVIRADGTWVHDGTPMGREAMVRLFASVLKVEDGRYYLVTPVEKLGIRVEDAPFLAVDAEIGADAVTFTTNLGERVEAGPDNPIRVVVSADGSPRPYVHVRRGLEALIDRKTFYRLVEAARPGPDGRLGLGAGGRIFPLEGGEG